jgi:hypothetical protein
MAASLPWQTTIIADTPLAVKAEIACTRVLAMARRSQDEKAHCVRIASQRVSRRSV